MIAISLHVRIVLACAAIAAYFGVPAIRRQLRKNRYARGRKLERPHVSKVVTNGLEWGPSTLPRSTATRHFLAVGTTGSGKSLLQRRLMQKPLTEIFRGSDRRALIFDAKNDVVAYLKRIGVSCPVYSLNPLEARTYFPKAVRWDIAADVTSPARAMNLVAGLIPSEKGGSNQYFTDSARQVVTAIVESFMRHSPGRWTFSDFVFAALNRKRIEELLGRDAEGREVLDGFFGDDRTAYQVFTTICSRMSYFKPVAALWQRTPDSLSLRDWLKSDSILLFGSNTSVKTALDAINEVIIRVITEEIDEQQDSETRRTFVWLDEARLCGPVLSSQMLALLAVKGRSRGACLVLGFQDIEGFREVAGPRLANEIIAQCSHKAILRMESQESAKWASEQLGGFETIEVFRSESGELGKRQSVSEQRVLKDAVLPSEFYSIPVTSKENGLTGYFLSPEFGAVRGTVRGDELQQIVVSGALDSRFGFCARPDCDQVFRPWTDEDRRKLGLIVELERTAEESKKRLRLKEQPAPAEQGRGTRNGSSRTSSPGPSCNASIRT